MVISTDSKNRKVEEFFILQSSVFIRSLAQRAVVGLREMKKSSLLFSIIVREASSRHKMFPVGSFVYVFIRFNTESKLSFVRRKLRENG